ncbi:MAG: PhoH family protein [Rhodobacteraceae bacterium]|nr:PhoH family protein [Paracoccaceae bacterium]
MSKKKKNGTTSNGNAKKGRNTKGISNLRNVTISPEFWTQNQEVLYNSILKSPLTFATGPAGTGKTYIAALAALMILKDPKVKIKKIFLTKPIVEAGEKLGFLPGSVEEKTDPFMYSFYSNIQKITTKSIADIMVKDKTIEVMPLAYMRGVTLENCVAILDEAQNTTPVQVKLFLSRLGRNAKMIVAGDQRQQDIYGNNGLTDAKTRLSEIDDRISFVNFKQEDIVRHSLVTKILTAYEEE